MRIWLLIFLFLPLFAFAQEEKAIEYDPSPESFDTYQEEEKPAAKKPDVKAEKDEEEKPEAKTDSKKSDDELIEDAVGEINGKPQKKAKLQGLNKVTARSSIIEAETGNPINFGNLSITVKKCWKSANDENPENSALLEIWDETPGEEKKRVFNGWMFSSSPGLSALEHAVYDIVVVDCYN